MKHENQLNSKPKKKLNEKRNGWTVEELSYRKLLSVWLIYGLTGVRYARTERR